MLMALPVVLGYGWLFWLLGNLLDVAWRAICWFFQPLVWLQGKAASLAYGPSPRRLQETLDRPPILLLTSYNDEADLTLQIGSAPARLYQEYVATSFSQLGRLLELVFLRPFVLGVFLKAIEMLLEVASLGFSVWRTLFLDYDVAPAEERPYYPAHVLERRVLDIRPAVDPAIADLAGEQVTGEDPGFHPDRPRGLRFTLEEVTGEIRRQIQLRHSAYYDSDAVISQVAEFLAGEEVNTVRSAGREVSP